MASWAEHRDQILKALSNFIVKFRYDSLAVDFDVAMLRLEGSSRSSSIEHLCLPPSSFDTGAFCVIAGNFKLTQRARANILTIFAYYLLYLNNKT